MKGNSTALDDPAVKRKVGQIGEDICPEHNVREACVFVVHSHTWNTCYRVFKFACGHLSALEQDITHCSDGDTREEELDHALGHILSCKDTSLCPSCHSLGEAALSLCEKRNSSDVFGSIKTGLEEAISFSKGEAVGVRLHKPKPLVGGRK